jgi:hypothetical protein
MRLRKSLGMRFDLTRNLPSQPNKRLQRTGISVSLIDNLPLAQLSPAR